MKACANLLVALHIVLCASADEDVASAVASILRDVEALMGDRREGVHNVVALEEVPLKLSSEASAAARPVASHAAEAPAQSSPHDEPAAAKAPADPILSSRPWRRRPLRHNLFLHSLSLSPIRAFTHQGPGGSGAQG
jgi:hypothetical protein